MVAELVFIACVVGIVTEALHGFLVGVGVHTEGFGKLAPRTRSAAVPSLAEPLVCAKRPTREVQFEP